ncbi:MAG: MEKHLA domain-containing protein [Myxococcales bacterium]
MTALPYDLAHVRIILDSHRRLLGRPLVERVAGVKDDDLPSLAHWLYAEAPFCLLAHSAEADPRFTYANQTVLRCFEYSAAEFLGLPSRLSAEPDRREEREHFVQQVRIHGYAEGYRGLRIAKSGRRFWIEEVTMWNLLDAAGERCGQAAKYQRITPA